MKKILLSLACIMTVLSLSAQVATKTAPVKAATTKTAPAKKVAKHKAKQAKNPKTPKATSPKKS